MRLLSKRVKMVLQILSSSPSTLAQYSFANFAFSSLPLVFFFLLDAGDDTPCCAAAAHDILVRHRQEVALFDCKLIPTLANCLHMVSHFIVALSLLGKLCKVNGLSAIHHDYGRTDV